MNTLHFKYAVEVERTGSITQAAENLFMAQPNLSKAIRELEDTLGIVIFKRTSKGVIPTPKGAEFLAYAKDVLALIDKMNSLQIPNNSDRQCFSISIPRGSYIADAFRKFVCELDKDREIHVKMQETNSMQAITNIVDNQFHLGIIRYNMNYERYFLDYLAEKKLNCIPIWEFECVLLMSKLHPLASSEKIKYRELEEYTEILHGDMVVPYLSANEIKRIDEYDFIKKKICIYERCSQFEILTSIPDTYMWVSPVPEHMLKRYELVQRKCCSKGPVCKDLLIYPSEYKFSELDKIFINKLHETKDQVALKEYC